MCSKTLVGGWTSTNVPQLTSCTAGNRVLGFIGTSQASPHVAGLAALLVAEMGHGQPQQIKQAIVKSADPANPLLARGRMSVRNALGF
jgi:subtilisin family serine protease